MSPAGWRALPRAIVAAVAVAGGGRAEDIPFVRVNVPAAALRDVPRADGRFVPMPLTEFEEAVARLGPDRGTLRLPHALSARYVLAADAGGDLEGTIEFTIDPAAGAIPAEVPLGRVAVARCTIRTAEGTGEAVVFGMANGGVAVRTAGAGTYSAAVLLSGAVRGQRVVVPLLPALVTTLDLTLPESTRPFVTGAAAATAVVERGTEPGAWRIVVGPVSELPLVVRDEASLAPAVATWNSVIVRGRRADIVARAVPATGWNPGQLELSIDPATRIARVWTEAAGELPWRVADERLVIDLPRFLVGSRESVLVAAVAPLSASGPQAVPSVRAPPDQWAGCGVRLLVDPAFAIQGIELEQAVVVAEAEAAAWPLPDAAGDATASLSVADGVLPPRVSIEHQAALAVARVVVADREPIFDTARITTVDISPGTVLGRANCDVRVVSGEAFEIVAEVAAGWFIDSVEPVDWTRPLAVAEATPGDSRLLDWRVVRSPRNIELRIGLAVAATPGRPLGLRISGHRAGLPLGAEFASNEMDMIRLPGEASGSALLELRVGPTAVVEVPGGTMGLEPATGRLAALAGESPPRARIRAGERSESVRARLVRRRPPVDADVRVAVMARDERLSQSFTFTCRPAAGELDTLVVHFSEPLGAGLEWSLVDPAGGTLAARSLGARGPAGGSAAAAAALGLAAGEWEQATSAGIAESWLVELRPATTSAVTIRAARTVPLEEALAVPLAWVEAAERPGGVVSVRGSRGRRPEVLNRRLRELPAADDSEEAALVELSYGPPASTVSADGSAAADLLPPAEAAGARAWAWREETSCWCHDSGSIEWETMIDLENQGREEVTITVPAGLSLEGIRVGGNTVSGDLVGGQAGGSVTLPLPAQRGRIAVVVRGSGLRDARFGWWTVGAVACGIDVPILERDVTILLPPELEISDTAEVPAGNHDWATRLFLAAMGTTAADPPILSEPTTQPHQLSQGFRAVSITPATRGGITQLVVIRRGLISSLAIIAASVACIGCFFGAGRSGVAAVAFCVIAAGAALWFDPPWYVVARAAWWGGLAGTWLAGCRAWPSAAATTAVLAIAIWTGPTECQGQEPRGQVDATVSGPVAAAADGVAFGRVPSAAAEAEPASGPLRVFVTPGDGGGTALVPEQLFRRLADGEAVAGPPPVRVTAAEIFVTAAGEPWRIVLDIDADRGGTLTVGERKSGATWLVDAAQSQPGVAVSAGEDPGEVRLLAMAAGRHRVELRCLPAVSRQQAVEYLSLWLPPAPRAMLRADGVDRAAADAVAGWQCDRGTRGGPWLRAAGSTDAPGGFDVAGSGRVRLVRPTDARDRLVSEMRSAVSFNDIDWLADACRVTASFDVGGEREIVRSVVVQADPELEPVAAAEAAPPRSLGAGRWLLERLPARAGLTRFTVTFRRPLVDPVGNFEVPAAWLEGVSNDVRTVRLRPAAGLEAAAELPLGMSLLRLRAEDGPATTSVWRCDVVATGRESPVVAGQPRPRITARRRLVKPRGGQELDVLFAENYSELRLRCQIEAPVLPLVEVPVAVPPAAVIDRVSFVREAIAAETAEGPDVMDVVWSRVAADRILVVVQRPQAGRFRLEIDARLAIRPAIRGRVPLVRGLPEAEIPLVLTGRSTPPLRVELRGEQGSEGTVLERLEIAADGAAPEYELVREAAEQPAEQRPQQSAEPLPKPPAVTAADSGGVALELTAVDLAIDRRGRGWGLVRFELTPPQPVLTIRLPAGLRLFDVRVDGREVTAVPREGDAWDVRLHDIAWPRTVVAVIAGSVGGRLVDGEPIRLESPRIDGLAPRRVLWSLVTPAGLAVRVSEPARVLTEEEWQEHIGDHRGRQEEAFAASIATVAEGDLERLQSFAAGRLAGTPPGGERAWYDAWRSPRDGEPVATRFLAAADGSLTIRAVAAGTAAVGGRGVATMLLVGFALAGWRLASRYPAVRQIMLPRLHRWWWVGCGAAWLFFFEPPLPGWIMLGIGLWLVRPVKGLAVEGLAVEDRLGDGDSVASDTTRTFIPT